MTAALEPPSPEVNGVALRLAGPADCAEISRLSGLLINRDAHGLDLLSLKNCDSLLAALGAGMWATPMMAEMVPGVTIAFLALTNVDPRDLNASLVALFADDETLRPRAADAVGRYVALVQWAYPLQRIECRAIRPGGGYRAVLRAGGMVGEGAVPGLALRGGSRCDVEFLSTIREDRRTDHTDWSSS